MRTTTLAMGAVLAIGAALSGPFAGVAAAQEAIYIVRPAERVDDEKPARLSPQGRARASRLVKILRDAGITHIVVSESERASQTAAPLAARLGITPSAVAADDLPTLLTILRTAGPRARVFVVGHSDTIPTLLNALGCKPQVTIHKAEYDNLFLVVPKDNAAPVLMRLRY
jgi:broad specificity phosphatase PhoE